MERALAIVVLRHCFGHAGEETEADRSILQRDIFHCNPPAVECCNFASVINGNNVHFLPH